MLCAPCASGQSFKDGLKQLGKRLGKQVEQKVEQKVVEEATKQVEKQVDKAFDSMTGKQSVKKTEKPSERSAGNNAGESADKTAGKNAGNAAVKSAGNTAEKKRTEKQTSKSTAVKSARDRQLEQQYEAMLGPDAGKDDGDSTTPGVRLPKEHTALFAPLGYPVDASWGVQSIKPVLPPTAAAKQVDWVDKMPYIYNLDNQSAVEEYLLLLQCEEDGYIEPLTPADHRYDNIRGEVFARAGELNAMVEHYNEPVSYTHLTLPTI